MELKAMAFPRRSRALLAAILAALFVLPVAPGRADPVMVELGTDPANDGPPALDLSYLQVGRNGKNLEVRIGVNNMLPSLGGYPELPGIEWIFEVKGRTFVAEGFIQGAAARFILFELEDGVFEQLQDMEGTYDSADGYLSMLVPLKVIKAKRGTVISGVGDLGTEDVDSHVHAGPENYYPDKMATTRDYVVP